MTGLSTLTLFRAYQGAVEAWGLAKWHAAGTLELKTQRGKALRASWERVAQRRGRQANRFEAALVERFKQEEGK